MADDKSKNDKTNGSAKTAPSVQVYDGNIGSKALAGVLNNEPPPPDPFKAPAPVEPPAGGPLASAVPTETKPTETKETAAPATAPVSHTPPGNDNVTQNPRQAKTDGDAVKKNKPKGGQTQTVFVGELRSGDGKTLTPDDQGYQYIPSRQARPRSGGTSLKAQEDAVARARLRASWNQHDAERKSRADAAWDKFKQTNAEYRAKNEARRQGWKEGKFGGMKSIDSDTWEALGKRDGGYSTSRATDENGNLVVTGRNADGTPIFQETYKENGGSKFNAEESADAIDQLNSWWMKGGGFQEARGKIPKGVFGKDGTLDVSKIKTQDQFRAIQQVMNEHRAGMSARRNAAYQGYNESGRNVDPSKHDADMQYLLNKGVRVQFDPNTGARVGFTVPGKDGKPVQSKWSDQQISAVAQEYRRNDALAALQGFEEGQKNLETGLGPGDDDARTYYDDGGDFERRDAVRSKEALIAAGRAAGLRADQMADDFGNIDPARIRAALEPAEPRSEPPRSEPSKEPSVDLYQMGVDGTDEMYLQNPNPENPNPENPNPENPNPENPNPQPGPMTPDEIISAINPIKDPVAEARNRVAEDARQARTAERAAAKPAAGKIEPAVNYDLSYPDRPAVSAPREPTEEDTNRYDFLNSHGQVAERNYAEYLAERKAEARGQEAEAMKGSVASAKAPSPKRRETRVPEKAIPRKRRHN